MAHLNRPDMYVPVEEKDYTRNQQKAPLLVGSNDGVVVLLFWVRKGLNMHPTNHLGMFRRSQSVLRIVPRPLR